MSTIYLNGRQIRQRKQPKACRLNSLNQVQNNPLTTAAWVSTAKGVPSGWVGIRELNPAEAQFDWVPEGTDGALEVHFSKNRNSCWFAGGTLIARWPLLAVEKGYVRLLHWRIDETAAGKAFVVSLVDQPVKPTKKHTPKVTEASASSPAAKATKKASTTTGASN